MCHTCCDTHQNGQTLLFGVVKCCLHHVVGFLLVGWLEGRNHGKLAVEATVLLVLAGVHRWVIGHQHNHAAVNARHGTVHKWVGADVQSNVLHANQGTLAHEGHAQGCFHGSLLVCTPAGMYAPLPGKRIALYVFGNFGAGRSGVCIYATQSGIDCTKGNSLVA